MQRQDRSFIAGSRLGAKPVQPSSLRYPASPSRNSASVAGRKAASHPAIVALPIALFVSALSADILAWWMNDAFWGAAALRLSGVGAIVALLLALRTYRMEPRRPGDETGWTERLTLFYIPALAFASVLLRFADPAMVGAVIPWGLVLSAVISILLLTQD